MTRNAGPSEHRPIVGSDAIEGLQPAVRFAGSIDRDWLDRSGQNLLVYWPRGLANPFTTLLYNQGLEHGFVCAPCDSLEDLAKAPKVEGSVFHFHWLSSVSSEDRIAVFRNALQDLKALGGRIVWTAHNVLPHDALDIEQAIKVRKMMIEAADLIHILNKATPEMVEPYFSIRQRPVFYSAHPSYAGAYPNIVTRSEARFQLGLRPDATVFLSFGALRPYKGTEMLLDALEKLAREKSGLDWQLLVGGRPFDPATGASLVSRPALQDRIVVDARHIHVVEVQYYFKAADFCVLPYQLSLNSGVALLAMSFGVPTIVPEVAAFSEIPSAAKISYPPDGVAELAGALVTAIGMDTRPMRKSALEFAWSRRVEKTSATFFEGLSKGLDALTVQR